MTEGRIALSRTPAGIAWISQFAPADQIPAAQMLDALLLLDAEQVAVAQRSGLEVLANERRGVRGMLRRKVALYAEREVAESAIFVSTPLPGKHGKKSRLRATGPKRVQPVVPRRGSARVGSEGSAAFVVSQSVRDWPRIFVNHPGPEIIRNQNIGTIAIVTDFVGSGARICSMLDKFWNTPSVRSWFSLGWIKFCVVAASGTDSGRRTVSQHRTNPRVIVRHVAPTLDSAGPVLAQRWRSLIARYGPTTGTGAYNFGFRNSGALIAFSYRIPNNTPAIIHASGGGWRALFPSAVPEDTKDAFRPLTTLERIARAAESSGLSLTSSLDTYDAQVVMLLGTIRGRLRPDAEPEIAARSGLTEPEVREAKARAEKSGLIDQRGRLTDRGRAELSAGIKTERKPPAIPTNAKPYYPAQLRVSRVAPSIRRPSRRP